MLTLLATAFAAAPSSWTWARGSEAHTLRFAIVGTLAEDDTALREAVSQLHPDVRIFTTLAPKSELNGWDAGPLMAFPRGSRARARWLKRLDGVGLPDLPRPVPYGTVDFVSQGTRWRLLYLTTAATPVRRWEEQTYWLPKALDDADFDRLIVVSDGARHSLSDATPARGARVLFDRVQDAIEPMSFVGWIGGNTFSNEVYTPGGRYGELHLAAGDSGGDSKGSTRVGHAVPGVIGRETLEPAFDNVVQDLFGDNERYQIAGFWMLEIAGDRALLDFHHDRGAGYEVVYRMVRDGQGWHVP